MINLSKRYARPLALLGLLVGCGGGGTGNDDDVGGGGRGGDRAGGSGNQASGGAAGSDSSGGDGGQPNVGGGIAGGAGGEPMNNGGGQGGQVVANGGSGGNAQTGGTMQTGGTPPANVPCSQRPYCNDFEDASAGSTPGGAEVEGGSSVKVSTDKFFSGGKSLKIVAAAGSGSRRARFRVNLAAKLKDPKRKAYMRMMLYMDNKPDGSVSGHWDVFGMQGTSTKGPVTLGFGGAQNSKYDIARWLYLAGGVDCAKQTLPGIPEKKWTCVEVKINEDDAEHYGVNFDNVVQKGLTFGLTPDQAVCVADAFKNTWYVPKVDTFWWGWSHWHTQKNAVTFWIDDIVVDQQPIGCPPAK